MNLEKFKRGVAGAHRDVQIIPDDANFNIILAAGPVTQQPMTTAYRIVLRLIGTPDQAQLVVHNQIWLDGESLLDEGHFERGDYFELSQFPQAVRRFAFRLDQDAEHHYPSLERIN